MSKYVIEDTTLTSIANAVREKSGTSELIKVSDIPTAIAGIPTGSEPVINELSVTQNGTYTASNGIDGFSPVVVNVPQEGGLTAEELAFSGNCDFALQGKLGNALVNKYGNLISFNNVTSMQSIFKNNYADLDKITINLKDVSFNIFPGQFYGKKLPRLVGTTAKDLGYTQLFLSQMQNIREIPAYVYEGIDFKNAGENTNGFGLYGFLSHNTSLRKIPSGLLEKIVPSIRGSSHAGYYQSFVYCYNIDEINDYFTNDRAELSSNNFNAFCGDCTRLKNMTFKTNEDGTPIVVRWKNQMFSLDGNIGFVNLYEKNYILDYNSGITADKEVKDDATYQALKNDPDWFTADVKYSRYNHDSAVRTINSLPDTSAYLATAGGTNTIKFRGEAGELTDGGAINTLTEEEIAVAAAKGWTCSFV